MALISDDVNLSISSLGGHPPLLAFHPVPPFFDLLYCHFTTTMRLWHYPCLTITTLCLLGTLPVGVLAADILQISGFTSCLSNSTVSVNTVNVQFDRSAKTVTFDLAGSSSQVQNVTALLSITAYGKQVYQTSFDPCAANSRVDQLCPGTSESRKSVVFFTRKQF